MQFVTGPETILISSEDIVPFINGTIVQSARLDE